MCKENNNNQRTTAPLYNKSCYPERIFFEKESGGPLSAHLKRYEFAGQFCRGKVVLDAACGSGYGTDFIANIVKEAIGVDISKEAIIYAKGHYQKQNLQFKEMDIRNLGFPDKYFDVVCSFETFEHIDERASCISEIKRVLKNDGVFIISTPQVKRTTYNSKNIYHKVEFCREDFEEFLKKYFINVEIFGQRRLQSNFHFFLQKADFFHLRAVLPAFLRRNICHLAATRAWDEAGLNDFVISKKGIERAMVLIGVCHF